MKCRRLRFNDSRAWLHRLWCAECRKHRRADTEIQRHIDAYAAHLADRPIPSALLADVPAGVQRNRVWGLGHAALCVGIGAAASLAILLAMPHAPARKLSPVDDAPISASRADVPLSKPQNPIWQTRTEREKAVPPSEVATDSSRPRQVLVEKGQGVLLGPRSERQYLISGTVASSKDSDLGYINDGQQVLSKYWQGTQTAFRNQVLDYNPFRPPMKEDFVAPPDLTFATSGDSVGDEAAAYEAEYKRQAAIQDDRLAKAVIFESKCDSLAEVCASLTKQTGVQVYAGRSVADDNVTLYMTNRPARDVMRSLTRLFGYLWHRTGTNGVYTYTFEQEMKDQVAEDKLRNEDVSSALAKVVEASKRPSEPKEKSPLDRPAVQEIVRKQFGALSIDEFQELRSGKDVVLSSQPGATRPLESDKAIAIMDNMGRIKEIGNGEFLWTGGDGKFPSELPGTVASITYKLSVQELGGVRAKGSVLVEIKNPKGGNGFTLPHSTTLAEVPGVGEAPPNNAAANGDLAHLPELSRTVNLNPAKRTFEMKEKDYPIKTWTEALTPGNSRIWRHLTSLVPSREYMTTGDMWEAIHKATGMDIAADCFSRMYVHHTRSGQLFDLLNTYCDETLTRWRYQDKTLFARSTVYEWQRLTETPKRLIERWKAARKKGNLSINDLIAIGQLSDRQLDSFYAGGTTYFYHDIPEWGYIARPWMGDYGLKWRKIMRALGSLPPSMVSEMVNKPFEIEKLPQGVRAQLVDAFGQWRNGYPVMVAVDYIPSECFFWNARSEHSMDALGVTAPTAEALRKMLEKRDYTPGDQEIVHTFGHLKLVFYDPTRRVMLEVGDGGNIANLTGN